MRSLRFTREYVAGVIAGTGFGLVLSRYFWERLGIYPVETTIIGFALLVVGSLLARRVQEPNFPTPRS
jgi:hypothetical protein